MTMKIHELKIQEQFFYDVMRGLKTFEWRKDDRDFMEGDLIRFRVLGKTILGADNEVLDNTLFRIRYILRDQESLGLPKGYCILGIAKLRLEEMETENDRIK